MQSLTVGYTIEVHFVRLGQLTRKGGGYLYRSSNLCKTNYIFPLYAVRLIA